MHRGSSTPGYKRLYIERRALDHEDGQRLVQQFADLPIVTIDDAMQVFGRRNQNFALQKTDPSIIAAVVEPRLYEAPALVRGGRRLPVYYTDEARNCAFDCDYCFLQGMHPSAYPILAVNSHEIREAAIAQARASDYWLSVAYVSDILGFESLVPYTARWAEAIRGHSGVTVEVRTKGSAPASLLSIDPPDNLVLTWTLSPRPVVSRYERRTATLDERLASARTALERGFRVSLAIDPVLIVDGWQEMYGELVRDAVAPLTQAGVESVSYGAFRMGGTYMESIRASRGDSPIVHYPFADRDGVATYPDELLAQIDAIVGAPLRTLGSGTEIISMLGEYRLD